MTDLRDIALHEASHAAMTLWVRRPVAHIWIDTGFTEPGETAGFCMSPIPGDIEVDQLMIAVVGYMSTGKPDWPPSYAQAQEERLEGLDKILTITGIDQDGYERAVELVRQILADPNFRRLRDVIARALYSVPTLDAPAVEALCAAVGFPQPEETQC